MARTAIFLSIFIFALAGCGGESRVEAPAERSRGSLDELASAEGELKEPAKKPVRGEADSGDGSEKDTGAAKAKDVPPPAAKARKKAAPAAPKPSEKPAAPKVAKGSAADQVAAILKDLKKDSQAAEDAFLRIWEVPRALIPLLIEQVESAETSKLERIQVLVLDPDFLRPGEIKPFLANRIHGLGRMEVLDEKDPADIQVVSKEYTKMSYGITRNKHYKVVIDKFGGFPIGLVVRAGLINRFRSLHYPPGGDDDTEPGKLIEWWRSFYQLNKEELKAAAASPQTK